MQKIWIKLRRKEKSEEVQWPLLCLKTHTVAHLATDQFIILLCPALHSQSSKQKKKHSTAHYWWLHQFYSSCLIDNSIQGKLVILKTWITEMDSPRRSRFSSAIWRVLLEITGKLPPCWLEVRKIKKISYIVLPEKTSLPSVFRGLGSLLSRCQALW